MKNPPSNRKTRKIAGHRLTLLSGVRYLASRPMAGIGQFEFVVTITPIIPGREVGPALVIPGLCYADADRLINAFNNEPGSSWSGRVW